MKDAKLVWVLPLNRIDGSALPLEEIDKTEISLSADLGANFVVIGAVTAPAAEFTQTEMEAGDWVFRLIAVDTDGRRGTAVDFPVRVETPPAPVAAPGPVTNVSVTLT